MLRPCWVVNDIDALIEPGAPDLMAIRLATPLFTNSTGRRGPAKLYFPDETRCRS